MVTWHGMSSRVTRNNALKDLFQQWRGTQLGYDEGLIKGDAVFATAVWRNVFKAKDDVDIADLARVTAYMRKEIWRLGKQGDEVVYEGRVKFGNPQDVEVEGKAAGVNKTFDSEDLKALREAGSGGSAEKH